MKFIKAYKDVFYAKAINTPTGTVVLTPVDKLIYFHMLDRKGLFTVQGKKHFESQDTIGTALGMDRKTVMRSLNKMIDAGIITGHKEKHQVHGYQHWVYTDVKYPLSVVQSVVEDSDPF